MTSSEIRQSFFDFFLSKGHTLVPSAPVIPGDDPTLLFTNAGMNQFKDVFLGTGQRPYTRAVDTQKCIRVSGKHNDLEEVGRDTYHHTFFEMLGNWSFGDYYKQEAIAWAWELLTKVWGLPKDRLWATVYTDDDEADRLWKDVTDIDHAHVLRFGAKDNFWEMGDTGPCGPCSEIHIDLTPDGSATADMVNAGTADVIEIWNLVFIQYDRDTQGTLHPLPAKHVDTGMGFERICAVLQKRDSNYDSDVFLPLIHKVSDVSGTPYDGRLSSDVPQKQAEADTAMRVIADHVRTLTFAIADGAVPSNEGRGYVLRRILRRAARFGRRLDMTEPFLFTLVETICTTMGDIFPEVVEKQEHVQRVIRSEEESFNATLDRGLEEFELITKRMKKRGINSISGDDAFKLYDTFGFPIDLTALLAHERGFGIDEEGFNASLDAQKERSRKASKESGPAGHAGFSFKGSRPAPSAFKGYTKTETRSVVTGVQDGFVTLDETPFYAESGGQVGDSGILEAGETTFVIRDTQKDGNLIGHRLDQDITDLLGSSVIARIDSQRRTNIARNHTATHIVHEALRRVLGEHLHQQGSLVTDSHLRFDFNHFERPSKEDLQTIEDMVNGKIEENIGVQALNAPSEWVSIDEAKKRWPNVKMFFGEKYGDRVRVVEVDPSFSVELCGGTHVSSTSEIGYFAFRTEGSVASGIRRIEAVTGDGARILAAQRGKDLEQKVSSGFQMLDELFSKISEGNDSPEDLQIPEQREALSALVKKLDSLHGMLEQSTTLRSAFRSLDEMHSEAESIILGIAGIRKRVDRALAQKAGQQAASDIEGLIASATSVESIPIVASRIDAATMDALKAAGDALRAKLTSGVGVLITVVDEKVQIVCVVTDDLISSKNLKAGAIVGQVAKRVHGGGGGKPHLATAGGKDVSKVTEALDAVPEIIRSFL